MKQKYLILYICIAFFGFCWGQNTPGEFLLNLNRVSIEAISSDGKSLVYKVRRVKTVENTYTSQLFLIDLATGKQRPIHQESKTIDPVGFNKEGNAFFVKEKDDLYQIDLFEISKRKIASTQGENLILSPDEKHVLFTKEVKIEPNINDLYPKLNKTNAKLINTLMYRHWNRWSNGSYSHLFISKVNANDSPLDLTPKANYHTPMRPFGGRESFAWHPNGHQLAYVSKKLHGVADAISTNSDIFLYDLKSNQTKNLTQQNKGYDTSPRFSPDGRFMAWCSMKRDGYESDKNDIKILDLQSGKTHNLTKDWDNTVDQFVWGKNVDKIYFLAAIEATHQLFELDVKQALASNPKAIRQITKGDHDYVSIYFADNKLLGGRQDFNRATEIYKVDIASGKQERLTGVNDLIYSNLKPSKVEKRWITTADNKKMLTWVIYPPDFDPKKKYPTLLYCQGGPQAVVSPFYSFRWNFQAMAQQGYIVVAPNRRGLPSFGTQWNETISKNWGGLAMQDYLSAIDDVSKESFVDKTRLGAIGASFGGYSVFWLAGNHKKRFKSFISHCGMFNMDSWYGLTEEMFFANWDLGGPYWDSRYQSIYQTADPKKFVKNWDTPILIIHGALDFRVPENQGMEAFQAAQLRGIKSRLLYFPDEGHWVQKPQNSLIWHDQFFKWLKETL